MKMVVEPGSPQEDSSLELSSMASACLLSLVVARGDTGKMLSALAAMLTGPRELSEAVMPVRV